MLFHHNESPSKFVSAILSRNIVKTKRSRLVSLSRNWRRAPILLSDWSKHFVVVWGADRFATLCACLLEMVSYSGRKDLVSEHFSLSRPRKKELSVKLSFQIKLFSQVKKESVSVVFTGCEHITLWLIHCFFIHLTLFPFGSSSVVPHRLQRVCSQQDQIVALRPQCSSLVP